MNSAKRTFGRVTAAALGLAAAGALLATPARAVELITNGNFETGTFAGWSVLLQSGSSGGFFIDTPGSSTPGTNGAGETYQQFNTDQNDNSLGATLGGSSYAVSTSAGPGTRVLYQVFTVPLGNITSVTLRYNYFVGNLIGPATIGDGVLDYTSDPDLQKRHLARIDLLRGNATNLFSTTTVANGGDLIRNFFQGGGVDSFVDEWKWQNNQAVDSTANTVANPPAGINITANVQAGQTYILRFAEVSNQNPLNFGIDNVSIDFQATVIPEPGTLPLVGLAAPGLALLALRRRREPRRRR